MFLREIPIVEKDDIAAVIDDEAALKKLYCSPAKDKLVLYPENPEHESLIYIGEELNRRILKVKNPPAESQTGMGNSQKR